MKKTKCFISIVLVSSIIILLFPSPNVFAAKATLNKKTVTLSVGKRTTLKISGTKNLIKWYSSRKKIATVNKKGEIKAISKGTTKITAKVGKKKYTCKVTVKARKTYDEGTYTVGKNIPAGEYVLFSKTKYPAYFSLKSSRTGSDTSIIANDSFDYNSIVTIKEGEFLELSECYAIDIKKAKLNTTRSGMFKIGTHLAAGEYKIVSTSKFLAYTAITSDSSHNFSSILINDNFKNSKYVTVIDGQYITIKRGKLSK